MHRIILADNKRKTFGLTDTKIGHVQYFKPEGRKYPESGKTDQHQVFFQDGKFWITEYGKKTGESTMLPSSTRIIVFHSEYNPGRWLSLEQQFACVKSELLAENNQHNN